jgi:hypothetical protein
LNDLTLFELPSPSAPPAACRYCHKPVDGLGREHMSSLSVWPVSAPKFATPKPLPQGVAAGECADCNGEIARTQMAEWLERKRDLTNGDVIDAWQYEMHTA